MSVESIELGRFLRARRDRVQPEEVGLPRGEVRRVLGLRREEVARLANISPEYYLRLEQGRDHQPSPQVVRAMGAALRLDEYATEYLGRLAGGPVPASTAPDHGSAADDRTLAALLKEWTATPALVIDRNHSVLATNPLGSALLGGDGGNLLLDAFASPLRDQLPDWRDYARAMVASFRFRGDPRDAAYQHLVGELSVIDADFRRIWALYEARPWIGGVAHRATGRRTVALTMRHFDVPGRDGRALVTMHADAGSPAAFVLSDLAAAVA